MFLPNYSGDGQGKPRVMSAAVNGHNVDDTLPVWSGDGRRNIVNPLMPVFHSDGARPASMSATGPAGRTQPPQVLPVSGDGQGRVALSPELTMKVNAEPVGSAAVIPKNKPRKQRRADKGPEMRAERSETWKLVTLVVIFLIWISTASTLLFLYMDRYLFP